LRGARREPGNAAREGAIGTENLAQVVDHDVLLARQVA
jgi:hypothetical protein